MMDEKINYKFVLDMKEWTADKGFVLIEGIVKTYKLTLKQAKHIYTEMKTILENFKDE